MAYKKICVFLICASCSLFGKSTIPPWLSSVPRSDRTGLVIASKKIALNGAVAPSNASLVKRGDGYLLFFTHDAWLPKKVPYPTDGISKFTLKRRIGVAHLDKDFNHTEEKVRFIMGPDFWMDPRVFTIRGNIYAMYYNFLPKNMKKSVGVSSINPETLEIDKTKIVRTKTGGAEKNWIPLISEETDPEHLPFIYAMCPTISLTLDLSGKKPSLPSGLRFSTSAPPHWKWGPLCGGTHAIPVDGVWLSFFHSFFRTPKNKKCYVMGACTFSKDPPHKLLAISSYPILFEGMCTTTINGQIGPLGNPRWGKRIDRVIFPCGLVSDKDEAGREVFHVSCGENDVGVQIVTIDKKKLFKTLKSVL